MHLMKKSVNKTRTKTTEETIQLDADEEKTKNDGCSPNKIAGAVQVLQDVSFSGDNCVAHVHIGDNINYNYESDSKVATGNSYFPRTLLQKPSKDGVEKLKQKLQKFYKKATLPRVSWLDEGVDLHLEEYYVDLHLESSGVKIKLEDILTGANGKPANRIFIDAQPGFGKTSLASKLVYDWSCGKRYLQKFKFAFFLPLRELQKRSITDGIVAIAALCGVKNRQATLDKVDKHMSECLLVLDGYDELCQESCSDVLKVLYQLEYSDMTVILTCRNGSFHPETTRLKKLFGGFSNKKEFYQKSVTILGVEIGNRETFLTKFCTEQSAKQIVNQIEQSSKATTQIFKSPLVLIMMAFIATTEMKTDIANSVTELYKSLINSIARYNVTRSGGSVEKNFDVFNPKTKSGNKYFGKFGKVAVDLILQNQFQLEANELNKKMYNSGFLIKHESKTHFQAHCHFEPFHLSFLEFFAAFAIRKFFQKSGKLNAKMVDSFQLIYLESGGTSLVLPFLVGLMGAEVHHLFRELSANAYKYSNKQMYLWKLVAEIPCWSGELAESVVPFLPPFIRFFPKDAALNSFYASDNLECIIRTGIESGKIQGFDVKMFQHGQMKLPNDVPIPSMAVNVNHLFTWTVLNQTFTNASKFQFNRLTLEFNCEFKNNHEHQKFVADLFYLYAKLSVSKRILWIINDSVCSVLNTCVKNGFFPDITFHAIQCKLWEKNQATIEVLTKFLETDRISELILNVNHRTPTKDLSRICTYAAKSNGLTCLVFEGNSNWQIDLKQITNDGKKDWDYLNFVGIKVGCSKPLQNSVSIRHLRCSEIVDFKVLTQLVQCPIQVLECTSDVIYQLQQIQSPLEEPFWKSLVDLTLLSLQDVKKGADFPLTKLTNLQTLSIHFSNETAEPIADVVECLRLLPITQLEIRNVHQAPQVCVDFIRLLAASFKDQSNQLQVINIHVEQKFSYLQDIVDHLLTCLENNFISRVAFVSFYIGVFESLSFGSEGFHIEHVTHGSAEADPQHWRMQLDKAKMYHKLTISKKL